MPEPKAYRQIQFQVPSGAAELILVRHGESEAVFAHGGIIGEMLSQAMGAQPFAFTSDNTGISQLVITPQRWIVRRFNDTAHLDVGLTVRPRAASS